MTRTRNHLARLSGLLGFAFPAILSAGQAMAHSDGRPPTPHDV